MFVDKKCIKNYDKIVDNILNDPNFEDIEDIGCHIDKFDKERDFQTEKYKQMAFTIIRDLLKNHRIKPCFIGSFVKGIEKNPPKTEEEIFNYLDKYWHEFDEIGRGYLLFFEIDRKSK